MKVTDGYSYCDMIMIILEEINKCEEITNIIIITVVKKESIAKKKIKIKVIYYTLFTRIKIETDLNRLNSIFEWFYWFKKLSSSIKNLFLRVQFGDFSV